MIVLWFVEILLVWIVVVLECLKFLFDVYYICNVVVGLVVKCNEILVGNLSIVWNFYYVGGFYCLVF